MRARDQEEVQEESIPEVKETDLDPYREMLEKSIPPGLQEYVMNLRGRLVRELEALFSNVLIRKPDKGEKEKESERDEATSEEVTYTEEGSNPEGYSTKEYESKSDDELEEELKPEMISSHVGSRT